MATIPSAERRTRQQTKQSTGLLYLSTLRGDLQIPPSVFSLEGFRDWVKSDDFPEKLRVAFIDGEVYVDMPNEELFTHLAAKDEIISVWRTLNREIDLGECFGDGCLVTNEEAKVSNNPEAVLITWESLESGRVQLIPRKGKDGQYTEIQGSLDMALEVVSESSVRKDTVRLREAYHRAGIREYWLVDARGEEVEFQILYWRKRGFVAAPVEEGWQRSRVLDRAFRFRRTRNRAGHWQYLLETKP